MMCRKYSALIVVTAVWPISFLINVFTALKGSQFYFLFVCFNICHIEIQYLWVKQLMPIAIIIIICLFDTICIMNLRYTLQTTI